MCKILLHKHLFASLVHSLTHSFPLAPPSPCSSSHPLPNPNLPPMRKLSSPPHPYSPLSHFTPKSPNKLHPNPPPPLPSSRIRCSNHSLPALLRRIPDWADAVQERGVRKPRPLYTPEDWREHRSSLRHLRHLLSSLSSRVILSLVPPVSAFTAVAASLALYNSAVAAGWLPEFFPLLRASPQPYQLTAPALALLLVFRTEASYSRYEEGRKAWMRVVAGANDLAGMVISAAAMGTEGSSSSSSSADAGVWRALLNYIMAFPVALKCHVISGSDINADLCNLLEEDDLAVVVGSKHRPRCVIEFISQSLQMLHMEEPKRNVLESKIHCFYEGISVCEQLIGIPVPVSYTRLTSRFLVLWHLTLPVILWDDCNWIVVPATFISAASLFCIEEVGVLIEEPFSMLSLDELCRQFHDTIREAMVMERLVHARVSAKTKTGSGRPINGRPTSA